MRSSAAGSLLSTRLSRSNQWPRRDQRAAYNGTKSPASPLCFPIRCNPSSPSPRFRIQGPPLLTKESGREKVPRKQVSAVCGQRHQAEDSSTFFNYVNDESCFLLFPLHQNSWSIRGFDEWGHIQNWYSCYPIKTPRGCSGLSFGNLFNIQAGLLFFLIYLFFFPLVSYRLGTKGCCLNEKNLFLCVLF